MTDPVIIWLRREWDPQRKQAKLLRHVDQVQIELSLPFGHKRQPLTVRMPRGVIVAGGRETVRVHARLDGRCTSEQRDRYDYQTAMAQVGECKISFEPGDHGSRSLAVRAQGQRRDACLLDHAPPYRPGDRNSIRIQRKNCLLAPYVHMPKTMRHFAWAKGETILQLHGIGPFEINYVNPADDPRPKKD